MLAQLGILLVLGMVLIGIAFIAATLITTRKPYCQTYGSHNLFQLRDAWGGTPL